MVRAGCAGPRSCSIAGESLAKSLDGCAWSRRRSRSLTGNSASQSAGQPVGSTYQGEVEPHGSAHHHVHLNRRAQRQGGDADRGACRVGLGEVLAVRLTHHREIGYISQVDADSEHVS